MPTVSSPRSPRSPKTNGSKSPEDESKRKLRHQLTRDEIVRKAEEAEETRKQEIIRAKAAEAEVLQLRAEMERLTKLRRDEKEIRDKLQPGLDDATYHKNASQKGLDIQNEANDKLRSEVGDLKARVEQMKQERAASRAEADRLASELSMTQEQLDERNQEYKVAAEHVGILDQWMSETGLQLLKAPLQDLGVTDLNKLVKALGKSLDHVQNAQIKKGEEERARKQQEAENAQKLIKRMSTMKQDAPGQQAAAEGEEEELTRPECVICRDNDATTLFVPCGHLLTCKNCADTIDKCPNCDAGIVQKVLVNM